MKILVDFHWFLIFVERLTLVSFCLGYLPCYVCCVSQIMLRYGVICVN